MDLGAEAELCKVILGLDANALYLHCIMQDMPVGTPNVRLADNCFRVMVKLLKDGWRGENLKTTFE